jgi:hypothetical protein
MLGFKMKFISKKDFTILLGNAADHFDTSLYIFIAPTIAPIFFPNDNPIIELIKMLFKIITDTSRCIDTHQ